MFLRALKLLKLASTKLNYVKALLFTQKDSGIIKNAGVLCGINGAEYVIIKDRGNFLRG